MRVRKATLEDVENIWVITQSAFMQYLNLLPVEIELEALEETKEDVINDINKETVLVVEQGNIFLGSVRLVGGKISRFAIHPAYQDCGAGTFLLQALLEEVRKKGQDWVFLYTNAMNRDVMIFYYKNGFYVDKVDCSKRYPRARMVKEID